MISTFNKISNFHLRAISSASGKSSLSYKSKKKENKTKHNIKVMVSILMKPSGFLDCFYLIFCTLVLIVNIMQLYFKPDHGIMNL